MKLLTLTLLFILFNSSAEASSNIIGLTLKTGEKISTVKNIRLIVLGAESRIDSIETKDGIVLYDTEIETIISIENEKVQERPFDKVKVEVSEKRVLVGGDGSGGG